MSKLSYKTLFIIFFFLLIPVIVLLRFFIIKPNPAAAGWWNDMWQYRQAINISSHTTTESNVYIIATVNIGSTVKTQIDGGDFRFVTQTGSPLSYYISAGIGTTNITFHIQFSSFPSGAQTIYVYYGNASVTNGFSAADFATEASNYTIGSLSTEEVGGGPIAYWKFDEGVGTTAYNSIPNRKDGRLISPSWQTEDQCVSGKCLLFDGVDDYISCGTGNDYFPLPTFSICAWEKTPGLGTSMTTNGIFSLTYGLSMSLNSSGQFWTRMDDGVGFNVQTISSVNLQDNKFHYLCLTYDGTIRNMYIDGIQKLSVGTTWLGTTRWPTNTCNIGHENNNSSIYKFNGSIDEVKIYPYARTAAQIKLDYNSRGSSKGSSVNLGVKSNTTPSLSSKLVAYYKFDEGQGTKANDSIGNNDGTINKSTWSNQGKYNKGLKFSPNQESLLLDYKVWKVGQTDSATGFSRNGSAGENFRVLDTDPSGRKVAVWEAAQNDIASNDDGGWGSSNIAVDQTKMYRFSTWIRRTILGNGTYYFGTYGKNSGGTNIGIMNRSVGTTNTNPYFHSGSGNGIFSTDSWFLLVGHVWPVGSGTGPVFSDTGLYNSAGTKIATPADFVWLDGTTLTVHRTYLYYSTDSSTVQQWVYPRVDAIDGTEPSIQDLLNGYDSYGSDVSATIADAKESFSFWYDQNSTGNWQHIVKSSSDYYVNGRLSTPAEYPIYVSGNDIYIGRKTDSDFVTGSIDEVKIYNYALTSDEIKLDYNQGSSTTFGTSNQTIGNTTTSLDYCIPGDTSYCTNPITEWKMDEKTGTTIKDTSGNNNTGTFGTGNSAPTWTTGKIGAGLNFNATNSSYVSGPLDGTDLTDFSYNFWFKTNTVSGNAGILQWAPTLSSGNPMVYVNRSGSDINIYNSGAYSSSIPISPNTWYHFSSVYSAGTTTTTIYINGISKVTFGRQLTYYNYGTNLYLGNGYNGFFDGVIDHVKIYNYARTPAQIAYDYNRGKPVGWWKLDECQGNIIKDSSGIGNTGIINIGTSGTQNSLGTCTIGTSAAWTNGAIGKFNSSLSFDGTDDYVSLPLITNSIYPVTLTAWFKSSLLNQTRAAIISNGNDGANGYEILQGADAPDNKLYVLFPAVIWIGPVYSLSIDTWYHVVTTIEYETSTTVRVKIYVNGNIIYNAVHNKPITPTNGTRIGAELSRPSRFKGQIDDVRIYNYALTSEQIKILYNGGAVSFN